MDDFTLYSVNIDGECLHQDFDNVDLYGEKLIDNSTDDFGDGFILE